MSSQDDIIELHAQPAFPAPAMIPPTIKSTGVTHNTFGPKAQGTPPAMPPGETTETPTSPSKVKGVTVIITLAGMSFLNTMGSGILIGALPKIGEELSISEGFLLWPASVYALAAGCLLLIFGAVADVVGVKLVWCTGSFLYVAFTIGAGLSQTAVQIIVFRTLLGIAIAMCLPTSVSLITNTFEKGTWRNVAFACNGMGQPLGYALGLILGGIFTDTIGWRWSYFMSAIINALLSLAALRVLPSVHRASEKKWTRRLVEDIDWIGAIVMSVAMGLLLYVLAVTTSSYRALTDAVNISLLVLSLVLLAAFPIWMEWQTRHGRPAIIPNKLWTNTAFTATCVAVFLCWASLNAIQYFTTLYFQRVQHLSALSSSLRFLPHVIAGTCVNVLTGYLISRVKVRTMAVVSGVLSVIAPILMATINVDDTYWHAAFWAMMLSPVNADILFTVSNLIISNAYAPEVQSLAGGVFNEVAQFGNAVGLAVTAAIAASVSEHAAGQSVETLMQGYRAAFWTIFAAMFVVVVIAWFGLKKSGTVGKKND